jgi:argininosuccinate lyase
MQMIHLRKADTSYPNPHDYGLWRACAGVPASEEAGSINRDCQKDRQTYNNRLVYCSQTDLAWIVCLHKAGVLDQGTAAKVLRGVRSVLESGEFGQGGESSVIPALDGDEDLGSLINLGRTMQEPMSRLQLRDRMISFLDYHFEFMETLLTFAEDHADAIMPGHTHFSQANPITLANYTLSLFDNMHRGLEQLELSYKLVNKNSGGCGATSGTVWPVDRHLMTDLLGMDELLEVTYDCEASQDHTQHLIFSIANILAALSKLTTDIEIWGLEEIDMIRVDRSLAGVSSMMPQKCHNGGLTEVLRFDICDVLSLAVNGMLQTKGEPHGDVMAMYFFPRKGMEVLISGKSIIRRCNLLVNKLDVRKDAMLAHVRQGYSCMTELVVHLVRELGYGGRRAHRICATLTRLARDRGMPAPELTGEMLDEAAQLCEERPPQLTTEVVQQCLDPVAFIHAHSNTGGPAPSETRRMVEKRRKVVAEARQRQEDRRRRIAEGKQFLENEVAAICGESN